MTIPAISRSGKVDKIMVGDREMELLDGFTLYITTKMGNPSYRYVCKYVL